MQAYLIAFSQDTGTINVLVAKKRASAIFFRGGRIDTVNNHVYGGPETVGGAAVAVNAANALTVGGVVYATGVNTYTVKVHKGITIGRAPNQHRNIEAVGLYSKVAPIHLVLSVYPAGCPLTNTPGEFVFPGGEKNAGETDEVAALREFREETGFTLGGAVGYTRCIQVFAGYSVMYVKVTDAQLDAICAGVNGNLQLPVQDRINSVTDDELGSAEKKTLAAAVTSFTGKTKLGWFLDAVNYLNAHVGTMAFA